MAIPSNDTKRRLIDLTVNECEQTMKVVVNPSRLMEGSGFPDHVLQRYSDALPLDLNPRYPLNMVLGDQAFSVDLAFGGVVVTCFIPWRAVVALGVGMGGVFWEHEQVPPSTDAEPVPDETMAASVVRGPWGGG